jgi:Arc/MetJ-type ribon-helix-helix transcriptional regulator
MANHERVTVTLPAEVVRDIDSRDENRSKFVLEAVRHELRRRRREDLHRSLRNPHPESAAMAEAGFEEWANGLPAEKADELVDRSSGTPVRWRPGKGWARGK